MTKPLSDASEPLLVCPICSQKLHRMNSSHLKKHGLTMEEFVAKYGCMSVQKRKRKKEKEPRLPKVDPEARVECPICGRKLRRINSSHLRRHGITMAEFKEGYGARWSPIPRRLDTDVLGPEGHRHQAHSEAACLVRYAVRIGMLRKPETCSECGARGRKIHGHHADYSKPFEVTWLCEFCHRALHAVIGRTG